MCKTKGAPVSFNLYSRRRSKYTLEEKKGIAKTKAKKRRDEETKYFNEIECQIRSLRSPYVGLPDKLVHNATLRLTNAWKISYHVLFQIRDKGLEAIDFKRKSVVQDIASDLILLITHRACDTRDAASPQECIFLYASPSVQNYIHVSGCHDMIGAKFDDFCTREELSGNAYLELRAPMTQKDKRPYPAIRCRVMRSGYNEENSSFQLGFFLLRAPLAARSSTKSSCAAIMKRHLNSATTDQGGFERHGPQYWRAMQSRRRAIIRGASRDLVVPEQLKAPRKIAVKPEPVAAQPKQEPESKPKPVRIEVRVLPAPAPTPTPPFPPGFSLLSELNDAGPPPSVELPMNAASGPPFCLSGPCSLRAACSSANSSPYRSANSLTMSPIMSTDDLLTEIVHSDIDAALRTLDAPSEAPASAAATEEEEDDVICLDSSLSNITPTIGLETAPGLNLSNLDRNEMATLRMMAATGKADEVCPCGLTTKSECLEILDALSLKTEPHDPQFPAPVKEEFTEETCAADQFVPKQENFDEPDNDVTFTADFEEDVLSSIRGFLVPDQNTFPPLPQDTKVFASSRPLSSCCSMKRSSTSQLFMDTQPSYGGLGLFNEVVDTCAAPRFIGDRSSNISCQFDSLNEDEDLISELLEEAGQATPMHVAISETSMTELTELVSSSEIGRSRIGLTKKMSETSMDD